VRDQLRERAERHLADVVEGEQIARFVIKVVQRPAQQREPAPDVGLVGGVGGDIGVFVGIASQHLELVPGAAPVARGDAPADLAQPQVDATDGGELVPLAVHDQEDLVAEVGQVRIAHAEPGEVSLHKRGKLRISRCGREPDRDFVVCAHRSSTVATGGSAPEGAGAHDTRDGASRITIRGLDHWVTLARSRPWSPKPRSSWSSTAS
jgi:hypothetical protein